MIYSNLGNAVFYTTNDEFIICAIHSLEEACRPIEVGLEYATKVKGKKIFEKRK